MPDLGCKSRRLIGLAVVVAGFAAVSGAATWLVAGGVFGLAGGQLALAVSVASTAAAALAGVFGQPLFNAGLASLLDMEEPPGPDPEELERWCALLRTAVTQRRVLGARSQREQMLRRGVLLELSVSPDLDLRRGRGGRARLRLGEKGEPWSRLLESWDAAGGRLVILGEPGYGKTFSALALIARINQERGPVSELFPLADWHTWSAGRTNPTIEDWLVDRLIEEYPQLTGPAAWSMVIQGRLVPVFDGLDEVPKRARPACRDALEAYAGRAEPFRPFVVTCRQEEYFALAPNWIGADRHVGLLGLDEAGIATALRASVGWSERWTDVIEAVERGNPDLLSLLRSPLRLAAAAEIYESRDPQELFELAKRPDAGEELWDLLLWKSPHGFDGATAGDVRRWLSFIAASLRSHDRQRLWLHELYLYAAPGDRRRFHLLTLGAFIAAASLPLLLTGTTFGAILGVLIGALGISVYRRNRDHPIEQVVRGSPAPLRYLRMLPRALAFGLLKGAAWGTLFFLALLAAFGLANALGEETMSLWPATLEMLKFAAFTGAFGGLAAAAFVIAAVDSSFVAEEPPSHLAGRGPAAVTKATRDHGLLAAAFAAALTSIPGALLTTSIVGFCFLVGVNTLLVGWLGGLNAWAFHHWTRWRLARADLLPHRLGSFLEWASEEAGHLRANDAYEFRHKELLDYLARNVEPVGEGNLSWDELNEERKRRDRARAELLRGDRLIRKHDYEGARKAYVAAFKATPRDARVLRSLNRALRKSAAAYASKSASIQS